MFAKVKKDLCNGREATHLLATTFKTSFQHDPTCLRPALATFNYTASLSTAKIASSILILHGRACRCCALRFVLVLSTTRTILFEKNKPNETLVIPKRPDSSLYDSVCKRSKRPG